MVRSLSTLLVAAMLTVLALPLPARAGIADSPLPVLIAGETTLHLYSVPGLIDGGGLGTFFSCTSTDTATMQVGVEVFAAPGGAPANDAVATSLTVAPGVWVLTRIPPWLLTRIPPGGALLRDDSAPAGPVPPGSSLCRT